MVNSTSAPLPNDILLDIFTRLPLSDIASLRRVRHFYLISRECLFTTSSTRQRHAKDSSPLPTRESSGTIYFGTRSKIITCQSPDLATKTLVTYLRRRLKRAFVGHYACRKTGLHLHLSLLANFVCPLPGLVHLVTLFSDFSLEKTTDGSSRTP